MTDSTPADICETVATVEPGDPVELEDEQYDWASSLDVVDASEPVDWDVPLGDDWWTRTLTVEGTNGGRYVIVAVNDGEPTITSYRDADGELDHRGDVLDFAPVTVDGTDTSETGDEEIEDDHECPECGDQFETGQHLAGHRNNPHTDCSPAGSADEADDEEHEVGEELPEDLEDDVDKAESPDTTEDDTPLPDDVTEADVERAVNSHTYLNEVADVLDLSPGRTRTLLVHLEYYSDVSEGGSR